MNKLMDQDTTFNIQRCASVIKQAWVTPAITLMADLNQSEGKTSPTTAEPGLGENAS